MKIKIDFVTNSSSTGHIVSIPADFIADKKDIIKYFHSHDFETDDQKYWKDPEILKDFYECLNILKSGDNLWYYGNDGCDSRSFNTILDICSDQNFLFKSFAIGGEGNNCIEGIKEEELNKWFMNTQLQKMKIEVKDA